MTSLITYEYVEGTCNGDSEIDGVESSSRDGEDRACGNV